MILITLYHTLKTPFTIPPYEVGVNVFLNFIRNHFSVGVELVSIDAIVKEPNGVIIGITLIKVHLYHRDKGNYVSSIHLFLDRY